MQPGPNPNAQTASIMINAYTLIPSNSLFLNVKIDRQQSLYEQMED